MLDPFPEGARGLRIVVVSPHLDDGVLSLGAAIAGWARAGARVEVLTVLACDPVSTAPSGGWDQRAGFATEGEAARARREEDRRACAVLGAIPVWLPFGSVDYERHGDEADVRARVAEVLDGAHMALAPGFPLTHPDHAWLARALAEGSFPCRRLGLYLEYPYARRDGRAPCPPAWLAQTLGQHPVFVQVPASARARLSKWRAIACYRSQLPLLGMRRSLRCGPHVLAWQPEAVAWVDL